MIHGVTCRGVYLHESGEPLMAPICQLESKVGRKEADEGPRQTSASVYPAALCTQTTLRWVMENAIWSIRLTFDNKRCLSTDCFVSVSVSVRPVGYILMRRLKRYLWQRSISVFDQNTKINADCYISILSPVSSGFWWTKYLFGFGPGVSTCRPSLIVEKRSSPRP